MCQTDLTWVSSALPTSVGPSGVSVAVQAASAIPASSSVSSKGLTETSRKTVTGPAPVTIGVKGFADPSKTAVKGSVDPSKTASKSSADPSKPLRVPLIPQTQPLRVPLIPQNSAFKEDVATGCPHDSGGWGICEDRL